MAQFAPRDSWLPLRPVQTAALLGLASLALLAGAWGFELIGHLVPCKLCLLGRWPHYAALPVALFALVSERAQLRWLGVASLAGLAGLYLWATGLSIYHAGVEWGWFLGPNDCGGGSSTAGSARDLLKQLETVRVVSCTQAAWRLFGLSLAGWNGLISLGLAGVAALGLRKAWRELRAG